MFSRITRVSRRLVGVLVAATLAAAAATGPAIATEGLSDVADEMWYTIDGDEVAVHLYFYWSPTCPHCQAARPFMDSLADDNPWIELHSHDITRLSGTEIEFAQALESHVGDEIQGVPAFFFCESLHTGFSDAATTGAFLETQLATCHAELAAGLEPVAIEEEPISLPIVGEVDANDVSLPIFTVTLAALDAFNPCAFFVLLFLLSLLVHARSRSRMAIIGGIFVLFSGIIYFVFMSAWLNVFLLVGPLRIITAVAGIVALALAAVNIKDYFMAGVGPSLSIPEGAKPGLFRKMRGLTSASSFGAVAFGSATLAIAANSYELLCTTGFPLAFTRVLTLNDLPTGTYYSYLLLYNVIYILPLLAIVAVFVWKLGSRKLGEKEGRVLKLLSGTMMAGLGLVMLFSPDLLGNAMTAVALLVAAIVVTFVVAKAETWRSKRAAH
ncbi:MAG: thioredoxin family protein [bacterium]|nr:thioredoxin family protein [bacterium]